MNLSRVLLCLYAALPSCAVVLAQPPLVTETKLVRSEFAKGTELLRKINGRWWSQDNREVSPPSKGGFFWVLDSKPGACQFFHHRPFALDRAESLHLWMKKEEVEAALGTPNRTFGPDGHAFWYYYASDGTKLSVRFMGDGVLGEAQYDVVGEKSRPVASIERELNGQSIYKLLQARATQKLDQEHAIKQEQFRADHALGNRRAPNAYSPASRTAHPTMVTVESVASSQPAEPVEKRTISAEAFSAIRPGATRQDILNRLGQPTFGSAISGDEGTRESLTYYLESGEAVVVRLVNGTVVQEGQK
jgi:outer membrane protein assembly factor BamE (lipoprotein component of BamABCDE complex)